MINDTEIFVSYRRDGGEALACLISEKLKQRGYNVFYDIESLRSGKFNKKIFDAIDYAKDVIVILPEHALDRCVNTDDWVRMEISHAIQKEKNIIPVMMRNFKFPDNLPDDIAPLKDFNGLQANMDYFDATFEKLLGMIQSGGKNNKLIQNIKDENAKKKILSLIAEFKISGSNETKYNLACSFEELGELSYYEEAAKLYLEAAESGYAPAQNKIGCCYRDGIGVQKNLIKAYEWLLKSVEQEDIHGMQNFALFLDEHYDIIVVHFMKNAADSGDKKACEILGNWYRDGKYVDERDYEKAVKYYKKYTDIGISEIYIKIAETAEANYDVSDAMIYYKLAYNSGAIDMKSRTTKLYELWLKWKRFANQK